MFLVMRGADCQGCEVAMMGVGGCQRMEGSPCWLTQRGVVLSDCQRAGAFAVPMTCEGLSCQTHEGGVSGG